MREGKASEQGNNGANGRRRRRRRRPPLPLPGSPGRRPPADRPLSQSLPRPLLRYSLSLSLYTFFFLTSRNVRAAGRQADHQNSDLFLYLLLLYYTIIKKEQENLEVLVYHLLI